MLPRSDRLIEELENWVEQRKGRKGNAEDHRSSCCCSLLHFQIKLHWKDSHELKRTSWYEQWHIQACILHESFHLDINMFRSKKWWGLLKSGFLCQKYEEPSTTLLQKSQFLYGFTGPMGNYSQPSGGWFGGRETPELGGKVSRWAEQRPSASGLWFCISKMQTLGITPVTLECCFDLKLLL